MTKNFSFKAAYFLLSMSLNSIHGADWPWFGGLQRDGVSTEKGLRTDWGDNEPKSLWKSRVGEGYSSVIEVAGLVSNLSIP